MKTILEGACKYCGQIRQVEVEANSDIEVITEAATMGCVCSAAVEYRMIKNGKREVNRLFAEDFPGAAEILNAAIPEVVRGEVKSAKVDTGWNVKGTVTMKSEKLNVKREDKDEKETNIK